MSDGETTCWTMIRGAAAGSADDRRAFAERYASPVRAYFAARWAGGPLQQEPDDALQEVFVELFRAGGALERVEGGRASGFRAYLFGIVRNVALRMEQRRGRSRETADADAAPPPIADDPSLARVFDRAWANAVMREAAAVQAREAATRGETALRRVELLRLRFRQGLPIRAIAGLWGVDAAQLHRDYAKARDEFRAALGSVVREEVGADGAAADRECEHLLELLG